MSSKEKLHAKLNKGTEREREKEKEREKKKVCVGREIRKAYDLTSCEHSIKAVDGVMADSKISCFAARRRIWLTVKDIKLNVNMRR